MKRPEERSLITSPTAASLLRVAALILPVIHFLSAAGHVYFGAMNADEGFYAIAARSVMQGDLPYRDFGYTQTPLLPYVNGPILSLTGYGLFQQRWLNGFWGVLALAVAARLVARHTNWLIASVLVASFSLSPGWMYHVHLGKTYAFTSLVVMSAAWVFVHQRGGTTKQVILGLLGVIGVGCRLPSAPFFAVLWLAAFWHDGPLRWSRITIGVLGVVLPTLALFGIFLLLAPEATRFWLVDFHVVSVGRRFWHASPEDIIAMAPVWWTALAVLLLVLVRRRRFNVSRVTMLGIGAVAAIIPNLFPRGAYVEYMVPFLLPFAGATVIELHGVVRDWTRAVKTALVTTLAVAPLIVIPVLARATGRVFNLGDTNTWLTSNVAHYASDLYPRLVRARTIVEKFVPPSAPLLGPNIILAAETGRAVPRQARMGPFAMTGEFSDDQARRLNLITYGELRRWLTNPDVKLLAFFTTPRANYGWSIPSFSLQPPEEAEAWLSILRRDFVIVQQDLDFLLVARPSALAAIEAKSSKEGKENTPEAPSIRRARGKLGDSASAVAVP